MWFGACVWVLWCICERTLHVCTSCMYIYKLAFIRSVNMYFCFTAIVADISIVLYIDTYAQS